MSARASPRTVGCWPMRPAGARSSLPLCDVYVLPVDAETSASGDGTVADSARIVEPRLGLDARRPVGRLRRRTPLAREHRRGISPPERLELAGRGDNPSSAATRDRLAFHRGYWHVSIQRLPLGRFADPSHRVGSGSGGLRGAVLAGRTPNHLQLEPGDRGTRSGSPTPTARTSLG